MKTQKSYLALNSVFPRLSETFVYQQYTTWQKDDIAFRIISSNKPKPDEVHPNMTELMSATDYVCDVPKIKIIGQLVKYTVKHPLKLCKGLILTRQLEERTLTSLVHLAGAVYIGQKYGANTNCSHSHFTYGATAIAWWLKQLFAIPYVVTLHGSDVFFDDVKDLKRKLEDADHLIGISEFNKKFIVEKYNVQPENISVIGMGIEPVAADEIINTPLSKNQTVKLLNVGRLSEQKAHKLLIQACESLIATGYDIECTIVGDGELREQLQRYIAEHELEASVKLVGAKFHEEVLQMYQHFDIFVMSSVAEGMPIVLMEAMGRGLPVIGPDISGIPELLDHGKAGVLFKTADTNDLIRAIKECIDAPDACNIRRDFAMTFISHRFNSKTNATSVAKLLTQTSYPQNMRL